MIRFLSSSLLALGLVAASPALAQESQVFEFDFDQQNNRTSAASPPDASREPITAPVRPAAANSAESKASSAPLPPGGSISTPAKDKDGAITIVGEPEPPATQQPALSEEDLFDLFAAPEPEEVTLSPKGLPPTTSVPVGPGEARVEKTKPDDGAPAKDRAASKLSGAWDSNVSPAKKKESRELSAKSSGEATDQKTKKPAVSAKPGSAAEAAKVTRDDLPYRRWMLARKAWSRVGLADKTGNGSLVSNRLLLPVNKAGLPK